MLGVITNAAQAQDRLAMVDTTLAGTMFATRRMTVPRNGAYIFGRSVTYYRYEYNTYGTLVKYTDTLAIEVLT